MQAAGAVEAVAVKEVIARSRWWTLKMRYLPTPEEAQMVGLTKEAPLEVVDHATEAALAAACTLVENQAMLHQL